MTRSPTPVNLWLRHRRWFLRLSIPPSLRQHFGGKDHIVESLGTGDIAVAIEERDRRVAAYRAQFEALRTGTAAATKVYTHARVNPGAADHASLVLFPYWEVAAILHLARDQLEDVRKLVGIPPEEFEVGSPKWLQYGREILMQKITALAVDGKIEPQTVFAYLKSTTTPAPAQSNEPVAAVPAAPAQSTAPNAAVANGNGERFSEAFAAYLTEIRTTDPTTIAAYRGKAKVFEDYCRDAPLAQITRTMAADFLDQHLVVGRGLRKHTRNLYAKLLAAVFRSALRRGRFVGVSPFEGQMIASDTEHYEPFTPEEIRKLFAPAKFVVRPKKHSADSALPWGMLIGAYTGARLEEISQLRKEDIQEREGVKFFNFHAENGNRLKNKTTARCVPIHPKLIAAGLLDYVNALPKGGRLFPALKLRKSRGKIGGDLSDAFRLWRKSVGVVDRGGGLNFHSFRHTITNMLERLGVPQTDAARVTGHKINGITYSVYSHDGPGLKRLQKIVEKIKHPGLVTKRV
jgi:integrase